MYSGYLSRTSYDIHNQTDRVNDRARLPLLGLEISQPREKCMPPSADKCRSVIGQ